METDIMLAPTVQSSAPSMSDLAPSRTDHRITRLAHDGGGITLHWDDGRCSRFPARWLRDNCPCAQCRHPQALERTYMFVDHAAPAVDSAALDGADAVEVRFVQDDVSHVSRFAAGWLRINCCSTQALEESVQMPRLWDAEISSRLCTLDSEDYLRTDTGLREWIGALLEDGIVLLRGVPTQPGTVLEVARRIGPVRATNFGESYDVVSMPNPNASAYTAMGLELHTDLPNWQSPPDVQMLCCLKSSVRGGESLFADGFRVAEDLRREDPVAFDLLAGQPLEFRFHDETCDIRATAPVIALDHRGRLARIRFNNWIRAAMRVPEALIEPLYRALESFWRRLRDPRYHLELRLAPGDLITYDNSRILHGRAAFDPASGERHLQGCYLNNDDLMSRLRLLDRA